MKAKRQILSVLLTASILSAGISVAAAANSDTGFTDVSADAWYADAVEYVRDNGLMNGVTATAFEPDDTMTRAMLAQTLYRAAGSPSVSGSDSFADTQDGAWYADAVL